MNDPDAKDVASSTIADSVRYSVKTDDGWGIDMIGVDASDGSSLDHAGIFGKPIRNIKIGGKLVKKARVRNKRGKWLPYGSGFDKELGDNTDITGIEIVGKRLVFAIHIKGGQWLNPVFTSDVEGEILIGNGAVIDALWIDEVFKSII